MSVRRSYTRRCELPVSAEEALAWHTRPGALERLLPPWQKVSIERPSHGIGDGAQVELALRVGPVSFRWLAEHRDFVPGEQFRDVQVRGPFAFWEHTHRFEPIAPAASVLEDHVEYGLPGGTAGDVLAGVPVRDMLRRMFVYRHHTLQADLAEHRQYAHRPRLRVAITGASGLIGGALAAFLTTGGHEALRMVRRTPPEDTSAARWDPATGAVDSARLEGIDAFVHLAGENIGAGRWTPERKRLIRASRVDATRQLCHSIARLERPPRVLVVASAIGYYGDRGGEPLDESSPPGVGFLPDVCREWEAASEAARERGIRVVHARIGVVLSPRGGALAKLYPQFLAGAGGRVGDGRQFWSWIGLDDVVGALHHILQAEAMDGPVTVVAPGAVTNRDFTAILARVVRRPALVPLPAFAARALLGEMADSLLLCSARVLPARLEATGYRFRHPDLESALRHQLGRSRGD